MEACHSNSQGYGHGESKMLSYIRPDEARAMALVG